MKCCRLTALAFVALSPWGLCAMGDDPHVPAPPSDAASPAMIDLSNPELGEPQTVTPLTLAHTMVGEAGPPAELRPRSGGGIVGALEDVARRIEGAGNDVAIAAARQSLVRLMLTPVLHEPAAAAPTTDEPLTTSDANAAPPTTQTPWRVTLTVELAERTFAAGLEPDVQRELEQELRLLQNRLSNWSITLNREQELRLKLQGETQIDLSDALRILNRWQSEPVTLTVRRLLEAQPVAVRLYSLGPGDRLHRVSEVVSGVPLLIEVLFNRPIDDAMIEVQLRAGGRPVRGIARRLAADERRYVTQPILPLDFTRIEEAAGRNDAGLPLPEERP